MSGGLQNEASGYVSSVGGGYVSKATGITASISGGEYNTASFYHASVSGGYENTANGQDSSVAGGRTERGSRRRLVDSWRQRRADGDAVLVFSLAKRGTGWTRRRRLSPSPREDDLTLEKVP